MQIWKRYRNHIIADILAGATGAVAGAPQAMGFAIIAGINPIYGLYTAVIPTIVGAFTTSSVFMVVGPTNALALVIGSTLIRFEDQDPIGHLFTLTLLVGIFQLVFGLLRLGKLVRFVSNAVMTGFITGAGILIILGQLRPLTGYTGAVDSNALIRFADWIIHILQIDLQTTTIGLFTIVVIVMLKRTIFSNFATLLALAMSGVIVAIFDLKSVMLVSDIVSIPHGLPLPVLPNISYVPEILTAAFAIALLASLQSAGLTRTIQQPDGSTPSIMRDLVGQGLSNIAGGFFQCMASGGSLSRTAVNISAGSRSRYANVFAGVFVATMLVAIGPLIERIPLAALAGQLIVAAATLLRLDVLRIVWRVNWSARLALVVTLAATLLLPLEYSIYIGVFISLLLYIYSSASDITVKQLIPTEQYHFKEVALPSQLPVDEPVIISVSGNLYFAAISRLEELLPLPDSPTAHPVIILRLRNNQYLGSTGIRFLQDYARKLEACGGKLILAGIGENVREQLERTGSYDTLAPVFYADDIIFSATERAIDYAKQWLAERYERTNSE